MHAQLQTIKPALRLAHFIFGREIHKGKHLGNLTLTKMHPTFAEKPRVRIGVVSVYMGLKIE